MNALVPSLLAVAPLISAPNLELAEKIELTYHPKIVVHHVGSDFSLYGCVIDRFEIIGRDPVNSKERKVYLSLYHSPNSENRSAVLILPPTGGVNILDQGYANEICAAGSAGALISGWEHQDEVSLDFEMHNNGALRALTATRHVVEFLTSKNFHSLGLLGTSIGAVAGTLTLGFETRIKAAALIVGSARFADIISDSDERGAVKLREERMRTFGFTTADDYKEAVRKNVWIEPSIFIDSSLAARTLVVSADRDSTVPTSYQLELAHLLHADEHIRLHGNHSQVIRDAFCFKRKEIVRFLVNTLKGVTK